MEMIKMRKTKFTEYYLNSIVEDAYAQHVILGLVKVDDSIIDKMFNIEKNKHDYIYVKLFLSRKLEKTI